MRDGRPKCAVTSPRRRLCPSYRVSPANTAIDAPFTFTSCGVIADCVSVSASREYREQRRVGVSIMSVGFNCYIVNFARLVYRVEAGTRSNRDASIPPTPFSGKCGSTTVERTDGTTISNGRRPYRMFRGTGIESKSRASRMRGSPMSSQRYLVCDSLRHSETEQHDVLAKHGPLLREV